jgi:hypothetical protein
MWFLASKYYSEFSHAKIVYIPFPDFEFGNNFKQLLDVLEIPYDAFIPIKEAERYKEVIIPDESFFVDESGERIYTKEYVNMIDCIRQYAVENCQPIGFNKAYFTYSRCSGFRQIGEWKLERFFQSLGYEIIAPETLSFKEQINVLINIDCFASTVGSCSHNVVFLKNDSKVVLIPRGNFISGYQITLDTIHPLMIDYIDSTISVYIDNICPWNGPFYYYLSSQLYDYFNVPNNAFADDFSDFPMYERLGETRNNLISCSCAFQYYLPQYLEAKKLLLERSLVYRIKKKVKLNEIIVMICNKLCAHKRGKK